MNRPIDMLDAEDRNAWGYQVPHGPTTRPRACPQVAEGAYSSIQQTTDNSVNKALPWCVLAAAFGFMGFAGMIAVALLKPWESESRAAKAEIRAEFAQKVADNHALAELALKTAYTAKDMTDLDRLKSEVKGAKNAD